MQDIAFRYNKITMHAYDRKRFINIFLFVRQPDSWNDWRIQPIVMFRFDYHQSLLIVHPKRKFSSILNVFCFDGFINNFSMSSNSTL